MLLLNYSLDCAASAFCKFGNFWYDNSMIRIMWDLTKDNVDSLRVWLVNRLCMVSTPEELSGYYVCLRATKREPALTQPVVGPE